MNYVNVPVEVIGVIVLLAQIINAVVLRSMKQNSAGLSEDERKWLSSVFESQKDQLRMMNEIAQSQWRIAQVLVDLKDELKECQRKNQC